jgi:hypothetical protein
MMNVGARASIIDILHFRLIAILLLIVLDSTPSRPCHELAE